MAIEYKGKVYRNLQEQVLKNKDDIVELIDGVSDITGAVAEEIGEVVEQVSELNQEIAKALKLPLATPDATKLVGITPEKDQAMISVGEGLEINNGFLNALATGDAPNYNYIPQPIELESFQGAETDSPWYGPENTAYTPNFVQPTATTNYLGSVFNDTNKYCEAKIVFHDAYGWSGQPNMATIYIADSATSVSVMDRGDYGSMGSFIFGLTREDSGNWKLYCQASYGVAPTIIGVFLGEKFDPSITHPDLLS